MIAPDTIWDLIGLGVLLAVIVGMGLYAQRMDDRDLREQIRDENLRKIRANWFRDPK